MKFMERARSFDELKAGREERDASPTEQWEYLALNLKKVVGSGMEQALCEQGVKGWELVAVIDGYACFKRRLP
jgi:hypothetical protein